MTGTNRDLSEQPASTRYSRAYDDLRSLLVSGRIQPNTRLTEAELTEMLNVSRGTIRSVLVRLAQEGYVTSEVNRGVRTRMFSVAEAIDILETREVLESALAAKCAQRATDEEIASLSAVIDAMRAANRTGDRDEYSRLNRRLHAQIRAAAHQETLSQFVDALLYPLVMRQYRDLQAPHPRAGSLAEHEAIFSAIVTRNPEAAAATMRHHLSQTRRALELRYEPGNEEGSEPSSTDEDVGERLTHYRAGQTALTHSPRSNQLAANERSVDRDID